ncbi:hypothetical protein KX816_00540 [Sphingosinicellaceae bacterium]|nr:hypothetical protein KX816_00540 [Sphingosinicellaceae bacterium]
MHHLRNLALAATAALTFSSSAIAADPMVKSGTITISETQFGFLVGGSTGGGTLRYKGKSHAFKIGGLAVGNIGVSKVRGAGTVYNLHSLSDFAGTYSKLEASATLGKGEGALTLKNDKGVVLKLNTSSGGLQLSAGAGGVKIKLK